MQRNHMEQKIYALLNPEEIFLHKAHGFFRKLSRR